MPPKTIEFILKILFFFVSAMYLYAVFVEFNSLKPFLIPLPTIVLGFLYLLKVKKKDNRVLLAMCLTVIAATLNTIQGFFLISVLFFKIEHLLFIKLVIDYIKPKKREFLPLYILIFSFFFILIFLLIYGETEKDLNYKISLIYGFISFSLCAIAFTNFLYTMSKANLLLFIGFFIAIASDCVYAIGLLDQTISYSIFLGQFLYSVSYYFIYTGFIEKDKYKIE